MGKRKKRKATRPEKIDQVEEQDRVRKAVMKVLRARVSSPGGGPAIMLPSEQPEKSTRDFQLITVPDRESSEDEMIIVDEPNDNQGTFDKIILQKEKKKKSRGERNKEKDERNKNHAPVDHQARAEFRKHVKRADEIVSKSKLGRQSSLQSFSTITQSRLTRKVGLYNQGKKSDRVLREPLPVNERILKRTEKDLKKILDTSNDLNDVEQESYHSTPHSAPTAVASSAPENNVENMYYSCCSSVSQPSESRSTCVVTGNEKVQKNIDEELPIPTAPQGPDLNNVAEQLCSGIDLSVFPKRDLFLEIQTELMRTLIINSRMTPSKLTPAIKRQARNSQSARRSLQPLMSSAEQLAHRNDGHRPNSESYSSGGGGGGRVTMDSDDRLQALFQSSQHSFNSLDHNQRKDTRHIPSTKSRPDDEPSVEFVLDEPVGHDSGNYSEQGIHNQIAPASSATILDFAEHTYSQEQELAADYSLSGMDMIRKHEQAMPSQKPMTAKIPYSSSLDFLDEMDRGPLHSTVPYSHIDHQRRNRSDTTSLFSHDDFSYQNQNPRPQLTTNTEDLFYEPVLMPEMMSPVDGSSHYPEEERRHGHNEVRRHSHKRRCWHADSDSDDSPVLCYKCLDPIKIPSIGNGYSPKFHPQRMY